MSLALQFNAMHALCVRLPAMFVLELPAADGTLEGRLLAAFDPYVVFQGAAPQVTLTALKADPFPHMGCWKRQKVFVIFSIGKQVLYLFYTTKPPLSFSLSLINATFILNNVSGTIVCYNHNRIYCAGYLLWIKALYISRENGVCYIRSSLNRFFANALVAVIRIQSIWRVDSSEVKHYKRRELYYCKIWS